MSHKYSDFGIRWTVLILCIFAITACASVLHRSTYNRYLAEGFEAERRGDLKEAREKYRRALINVGWGHLGEPALATASFFYGSVSGYLCDHEEAEKYLIQAYRLGEKLGASDEFKFKTYFELARFYFDTGRHAESLPYFESTIPIAKKLDVENQGSITFANHLQEYAIALKKTGKEQEAEKIENLMEKIRKRSTEHKPDYIPPRYHENCPSKVQEHKNQHSIDAMD